MVYALWDLPRVALAGVIAVVSRPWDARALFLMLAAVVGVVPRRALPAGAVIGADVDIILVVRGARDVGVVFSDAGGLT